MNKRAGTGEGDINLSVRRQAWQEKNNSEEVRQLLTEDEEYFLHQSLSTPCLDVLVKCEGSYIENLDGKRYLDFHGNSVHQIGFNHPRVKQAVENQLQEMPFSTRRFTNKPAIDLAKRLNSALGGGYKALFAPGATSAIGMALKLCRIATGRFKTLSMWDSFHGASLDAISVGGEAVFREGLGPLLTGCEHVPPPDPHDCIFEPSGNCAECGLRCARYIDYVLEKEGDIGAVIAEPLRCTAVNPPPEGFWKAVRESCTRHGALLIFDETAVCLGRTGKMFAHEHYDVKPDLLVLGKGLGGGIMPLAALLARRELNVAGHTALGHYTHEKNPLACAAALAVFDVLEEEQLVERSASLGAILLERLKSLQQQYPVIVDVRGLGLMAGVYLQEADQAEAVMYACLTNGLSFKVSQGRCLTLTPPLTLSDDELDQALAVLENALVEL